VYEITLENVSFLINSFNAVFKIKDNRVSETKYFLCFDQARTRTSDVTNIFLSVHMNYVKKRGTYCTQLFLKEQQGEKKKENVVNTEH